MTPCPHYTENNENILSICRGEETIAVFRARTYLPRLFKHPKTD